ncbi:hypothetical protein EMIHUDRAFT_451418 [Emiliania huxleyi CCMP1516]|uniref:ADP,ATP carrier protein n=2 Tax=Emiliania huxleyi TaxID=2903 RepID=A0A0D3J1R4_EMIH1|nr:hypothetical protein EMIHUDRAFT_451418 [Emiliania huxleyi CCMP1516]EOD17449.1 hypothetical protein EMIHUDRAFT_451418 [Emiliania huxleyi CCMP1516]|eukprot:XP_005769878.1 hypothetical protein EMIHUDRAFT_451418 [Emiliania huxleyi CCMP1516]
MQAAAAGDGKGGPLAKLRAKLPPPAELKKVTPLGAMFFFILFAYTILRDTKAGLSLPLLRLFPAADVLVVTAPGSGAEIIPFLKTYVNLPGAIGFTVFYSWLSNKFSQQQVFTGLVSTFIAFFTLFAFVIYPNAAALHPTAAVDGIVAALPAALAGLSAPLAIIRNWTYAVFYTMAELWGSVVVSLLFWGFANQVTKVEEAKRYYPLFGLGANVALIFSGLYVRFVSGLRRTSTAADPWAGSLKLLMGGVSAAGLVVLALFQYMQKKVMTDPECVPPSAVKQSKTKTSMGIKESAAYLASSPYIRDLATLVICYGMSINIVEAKGDGMGGGGAVTLFMMLAGQRIFKYFGWGAAALVTPTMLFITGAIFFSLILFGGSLSPLVAALGTTPLMLAVVVGAAQNILSKSSKYSLFDPCKEMAYIPLDAEAKTKGKAAVDVIGSELRADRSSTRNPLGKSGGSLLQQAMIFSVGSLAASTPYLAGCLFVIIAVWLRAARSLNTQFTAAMAEEGAEA